MGDRLYVFCNYRNAEAEDGAVSEGMDLLASAGICQLAGAGRRWPTSMIVDASAFLLANASTRENPVEDDLCDPINRLARDNGVWVTLRHNGLNQLNRDTPRLMISDTCLNRARQE